MPSEQPKGKESIHDHNNKQLQQVSSSLTQLPLWYSDGKHDLASISSRDNISGGIAHLRRPLSPDRPPAYPPAFPSPSSGAAMANGELRMIAKATLHDNDGYLWPTEQAASALAEWTRLLAVGQLSNFLGGV